VALAGLLQLCSLGDATLMVGGYMGDRQEVGGQAGGVGGWVGGWWGRIYMHRALTGGWQLISPAGAASPVHQLQRLLAAFAPLASPSRFTTATT
jgi:hypothetical protein